MRKTAAMLVLVVLGLSACGSSAKSLSKQEWLTQADAICKKYDDERTSISKQLETQYQNSTDYAALAQATLDKLLPTQRAEIADLRKLKPASAEKAQVTKILDEVSTATDTIEHELKTDPKGAFTSNDNPFTQVDADAKAYGLQECGSTTDS